MPQITADSVVINDLSSQKSTTTLLHSPHPKYQHHLYNYWALNDRLRVKNEKLSRRQQTACRLAFYSLWLFVFAGVGAIIIYRFTEDCQVNTTSDDRRQSVIRCLRHLLLIAAFSMSFLSCTGLIYGACRYFHSQPKPYFQKDRQEMHLTNNYDLSAIVSQHHPCCCQKQLSNGASVLSSPGLSSPPDENSNHTLNSSLANISPQRKIPPFTYDELPPTQSKSAGVLSPSSSTVDESVGAKPSKSVKQNKKAFFSSCNSTSSSPQSVLSTTPTSTTHPKDAQKPTSSTTVGEKNAHRPNSYNTCACAIDVWERQAQASTFSSPH